jgi:hypothetical protein
MKKNKLLLGEMTKAILSYRAEKLTLGGLVNRLDELTEALAEDGVKWAIDIDDILLQLEIINSLMASGDKPSLSPDDIRDINGYLQLIESEATSHLIEGEGP